MLRRTAAIATLFSTLVLPACNDTPDPNQELLSEARECLQVAEYACARDRYARIISEDPALQDEKTAGIAIAEFAIWLEDLGTTVVELAELIADAGTSDLPPALAPSQDDDDLRGDSLLDRFVWNTFGPEWDRLQRVISLVSAATEIDTEVAFTRLPLMLGPVPLIVIDGTLTGADFRLLESGLHGAAAILAGMLAMDFELPLGPLIEYGLALSECREPADDVEARRCVGKLTAFAVENSATLLKPEEQRGAHFLALAQEETARFYEATNLFFEALSSEPTSSETRFLQWEPRPAGGAFVVARYGELPLTIHDVAQLIQGTTTMEPPFDVTVRPVRFVVDDEVRLLGDDIIAHLRTGTPAYLPATATIIPSIATAAEIFLQSDVLLYGAQFLLSSIDPEFAEVASKVFENFKGLYTDFETADAVHKLFEFLFPDSLQISYRNFFASDQYLRMFAPKAVSNGTFQDTPTWEWLVEWECDDKYVDFAGCKANAPLQDAPHFVSTPVSMPADGVPSRIAYVAFEDPTFDGALRLDPSELDPALPAGATAPTQETINLLIQEVGREFLDRLEP
ncbi:MAG: hypothetical protein D6761_10730 [Candidatus Dadabacteria bacterium]|nr:MAG: hypothetical protein D6761_10730 [Candidatus Dadabacteria bacterium]